MVITRKSKPFGETQIKIEPPLFTFIESGYIVKIAKNINELRGALKLRFDVFRDELQQEVTYTESEELETDQFDDQCYHLIVKHKETGIVVGTYRLQSWEMARLGKGFYAATQFEICGIPEPFLRQSIEIGRGCIHKNHRNGRVLYMLWKGLVASLLYMNKTTLFGCCSVFTRCQDVGLLLMHSLEEEKYVARGLSVSARHGYKCIPSNNFDAQVVVPEIPVLFQKYLDFGAKVCSEPAIDREFGTIDYLVMLHFHQVERKIFRFFTKGILL